MAIAPEQTRIDELRSQVATLRAENDQLKQQMDEATKPASASAIKVPNLSLTLTPQTVNAFAPEEPEYATVRVAGHVVMGTGTLHKTGSGQMLAPPSTQPATQPARQK